MAENDRDFTEPWDHGDITFVIEDQMVYANKATLSMSSPVMAAMFTSDFLEKNASKIPLPDKSFEDFVELMKVLHPPNKDIDGTNVYQVLGLGHEYQMCHVTRRCEKLLLSEPPSVKHLVLADRYSLIRLREYCIQFAKNTKLSAQKEMDHFKMIESATMVEILTHQVEQLEPKLAELQQKAVQVKPEPKIEPVPELSKEFLCQLISQAPSIKNLVLADLYSIAPVRQACINYTKDKKLSVLKWEQDFANIRPDTLIEVLTGNLEHMRDTIRKLVTFGTHFSVICKDSNESKPRYDSHTAGSESHCVECKAFRFEEIKKLKILS